MVLLSFMLNEAALNWHGWAVAIQRRRRYTVMNWWRYVLYAACHSKSHTRQKKRNNEKMYILCRKVMRKKSRKYNNKFGMAWPVCECSGRYQLSRAVHTMRKATAPAFDEFRGFLCRNQNTHAFIAIAEVLNLINSLQLGWRASVPPQTHKVPSFHSVGIYDRI